MCRLKTFANAKDVCKGRLAYHGFNVINTFYTYTLDDLEVNQQILDLLFYYSKFHSGEPPIFRQNIYIYIYIAITSQIISFILYSSVSWGVILNLQETNDFIYIPPYLAHLVDIYQMKKLNPKTSPTLRRTCMVWRVGQGQAYLSTTVAVWGFNSIWAVWTLLGFICVLLWHQGQAYVWTPVAIWGFSFLVSSVLFSVYALMTCTCGASLRHASSEQSSVFYICLCINHVFSRARDTRQGS